MSNYKDCNCDQALDLQSKVNAQAANIEAMRECINQAIEFTGCIMNHTEDLHVKYFVDMSINWLEAAASHSSIVSTAKHDAEVIRTMAEKLPLAGNYQVIFDYADKLESKS